MPATDLGSWVERLGLGPQYDALPPVPPLVMGVAEYGRQGALR